MTRMAAAIVLTSVTLCASQQGYPSPPTVSESRAAQEPPDSGAREQQRLDVEHLRTLQQSFAATAALEGGNAMGNCMNAIGDQTFCGCLVQGLPASVDFLTYVSLAQANPNNAALARMSADDRKIADAIYATRRTCSTLRRAPAAQSGPTRN